MENPGNSPVATINLPELLARVENDCKLLNDLVEIFCDEFPGQLKSLENAVARHDVGQTVKLSHALKGMLANLSVTKAAASAARLEQLARAGEAASLPVALAALLQDVQGLVPAMKSYVSEARS